MIPSPVTRILQFADFFLTNRPCCPDSIPLALKVRRFFPPSPARVGSHTFQPPSSFTFKGESSYASNVSSQPLVRRRAWAHVVSWLRYPLRTALWENRAGEEYRHGQTYRPAVSKSVGIGLWPRQPILGQRCGLRPFHPLRRHRREARSGGHHPARLRHGQGGSHRHRLQRLDRIPDYELDIGLPFLHS